ncbi:alpha/beta-hydrolase [Penicillium sp. IBT 35674x]|nr:alpha/beta-hydrolase [Penicillium sp. IBT 35674x]
MIYLDGIPYFSAFQAVGTSLMELTFQTLANPDASATELAEAIVFLHLYLMSAYKLCQNPHVRPLILSKQQGSDSILAAGTKMPISVIHGAKDKHLDVHNVEKFAKEKVGRVEFHALNQAGHMPL